MVQMFHANPDPSQWTKFKTGVVCLVKDNIKRSYYIRLIDLVVSIYFSRSCLTGLFGSLVACTNSNSPTHFYLQQTRSMVYEQELYHQFAYKKDTPSFHSFPGDVSVFW